MVWIHLSANARLASDLTDPAPLIKTGDVIVVSMNYRLGAFGFMAHPVLDAEGHPFAHIHRVPVLLGSTSDEESEFQCGALDSLRSFSKWTPTYAYEFADPAATPQGAVHAADLRYLFNVGNFRNEPEIIDGPFKLTPESLGISKAMLLSWAAFAASGNPSNKRIPQWPRASEGIQRLHPTLSVASMKEFSERHQCASKRAM